VKQGRRRGGGRGRDGSGRSSTWKNSAACVTVRKSAKYFAHARSSYI
jgi:hypothetical protein